MKNCGIFPVIFGGWCEPACMWHDAAYKKGSIEEATMTRKEVDDIFLAKLLELAKKGKFKEGKVAASYTMYGIVRSVGFLWWEGKN